MADTPTEDLTGEWKQAANGIRDRPRYSVLRPARYALRRLRMDQPTSGSAPRGAYASAPRSTGEKRSSIRRAEIYELRPPFFSPLFFLVPFSFFSFFLPFPFSFPFLSPPFLSPPFLSPFPKVAPFELNRPGARRAIFTSRVIHRHATVSANRLRSIIPSQPRDHR